MRSRAPAATVTLLRRDEAERRRRIAASRESPRLPGVRIDERVACRRAPMRNRRSADAILLAVPAQHLRAAAASDRAGACRRHAGDRLRQGHRARHPQIHDRGDRANARRRALPAILSGPSFASDVARGLPTAVTLAARDEAVAAALAHALGSATFRPYHSTDVRGVEIGGAAKNVLAIAAGIVAGRGLGASAAAALTTRGFAELFRFGRALGARPETLTGLSGLGDLILTCSSAQSRNFSLGVALGKGETRAGARKPAEARRRRVHRGGRWSRWRTSKGIEMPIATAVAAILDGGRAWTKRSRTC